MCYMIILASDGISEAKRCQHKADYCYQSFNRQHPLSPPFPDSLAGFYVIGGSQSLRRGLTAYHPSSPKEILTHFDRNFNQILFLWNIWKVLQNPSQNNLTKQKKGLENAYFTHFLAQMSAIQTRQVHPMP